MKGISPERKQERDEIRRQIIGRSKEHFTVDKSGKGYICPVCGSGNGDKGTGITENPKKANHFTCWRGCYSDADIFQIIGLEYGLTGFADQFTKACEIFGYSVDYGGKGTQKVSTLTLKPKQREYRNDTSSTATQTGKTEDFTSFYEESSRHITETDYHRGISLQTLKRFGVGYVPEWRHPKAPSSVPTSPRLIIPNSNGYLARDTRKELTDEQRKYAKQRVGHVGLFNADALKQSDSPIWIMEGEFDALSIIDAGGQAMALCSTTNAGKLIDAVKAKSPTVPLILALDNDEAGEEAGTKIAEALQPLNFFLYRNSLPKPYKDANEYLMADREGFAEWVRAETSGVSERAEEAEAKETESFEREAVAYHLPRFMDMVSRNRDRQAIPTGFQNLDIILGGGLYAGLYFIGAVSSLGKTTFALQIADRVAQEGHGVLIFSLEMSRYELMAKTLSRLSALGSYDMCDSLAFAKTTREVLLGEFTPDEERVMMGAIEEYAKFGEHVHITEGVGDVGTATIRAKTEQYIKHMKRPPVIVIDYTQILKAPDKGLTDKQAVDVNVVELKRISRDYDTPVIGISSFNRENYSKPLNMASFKESGSIEYSSDVLIGLCFSGWDFKVTAKGTVESDAMRMTRLQDIRKRNEMKPVDQPLNLELKVLKNRNGRKGSCFFNFFPAFNLFEEGFEEVEE